MANTGYIGNSNTATVGNILYWSRGYSTAAAGVCAIRECHAVNGPDSNPSQRCNPSQQCKPKPKPSGQCRRRLLYGRPVTDSHNHTVEHSHTVEFSSPVCITVRGRERDRRTVGEKQQPRAIITQNL